MNPGADRCRIWVRRNLRSNGKETNMTEGEESKAKAPEGEIPEDVAFVLNHLGYTTIADDFQLMTVDDILDIHEDVEDSLLGEGRERNDDINDYGDACLSTLSFLHRLIN